MAPTQALDALIEGPVVPSFTLIGYEARSRLFDWKPLDSYDLSDRTIVITGGTSGLGYAAAEEFAKLGATLVIVARSHEKTEAAVADAMKAAMQAAADTDVLAIGAGNYGGKLGKFHFHLHELLSV